MENCIHFFDKALIPYHKNIVAKNSLMIPGSFIKFKPKNSFHHGSDLLRFCNSIDKIIDSFSEFDYEIKIYVFLDNTTNDELIEYEKYFKSESQHNAIFVNDPSDIKYYDINYYAHKCGVLWTFVAQYDKYFAIFSHINIYVTKKTYDHAIVIMDSNEIDILNSYNIIIVTHKEIDAMQNLCYLSPMTTADSLNIIEEFFITVKNHPLVGGHRNPVKIIDGLTEYCSKCNKIFYSTLIHDNKCVRCQKLN